MKLLFIQGGTRLKKDRSGVWYSDSNFNNDVFQRYRDLCDELTVILRREEKIYDSEYAQNHFNPLDPSIAQIVDVPDFMQPMRNRLNIRIWREIYKTIEREVKKADRVIIRSVLTYYTISAAKLCEKYKKRYLIEVTGYALDGYLTHGILGKVVAVPLEMEMKRWVKKAPYVLYVTEREMQKRYKNHNHNIGCSDVEIIPGLGLKNDETESVDKKIVLGSAGGKIDSRKAFDDVIKALSILKERGFRNVEYQMAGAGNVEGLLRLADKKGVGEQVRYLGPIPRSQMFDWLRQIDIYLQPSISEGLCRAIVEAMSVGCAVIATEVGGNPELVNKKFLVRKKSPIEIAEKIEILLDSDTRKRQERRNYKKAQQYAPQLLNARRDQFYQEFMGETP